MWRSRLLRFPDIPGLRPTPDRVRQTLFNWLGQDLHGMTCLDLFAGTGVMGFESLSRGAKSVVMVEKTPAAYKALLENRVLLHAHAAEIVNADAAQYLAGCTSRFDIVFLDPPYHQGWLSKLFPLIRPLLADGAQVYAEAEFPLLDENGWHVIKQGKAGNVYYHLLELQHES